MPAMKEDIVRCAMPSGAVVFYKDTDHTYWEDAAPKDKADPDGEWGGKGRLTGMTTIVSPFGWESTEPLKKWAARLTREGIAKLIAREFAGPLPIDADAALMQMDWMTDPDALKAALERASLSDQDALDEASDRGSAVHLHTLNELAAGEPVPAMDQLSDVERGYGQAVTQFWLDHEPWAKQAEQVVCDLGLKVAGRLDFRGGISKCDEPRCPCHTVSNGEVVIIDLKTSGFIGNTSFVQTAGYDHLARVSGFGPSVAQFILKAKEDGEYRFIKSPATREDFLTAVEIYRRSAAMNKIANQERKVWE